MLGIPTVSGVGQRTKWPVSRAPRLTLDTSSQAAANPSKIEDFGMTGAQWHWEGKALENAKAAEIEVSQEIDRTLNERSNTTAN